MNIAVNLVGLSHNDLGNGNHTYKDGYVNLFKKIIEPLQKNHNVLIYLYTYNTVENENIIKIYNPTNIILLDLPEIGNKNNPNLASTTYINSLEYLKNEKNIDFLISTRFDLNILGEVFFDFEKFNFLFKELDNWNNHQLTTDTLYAFPFYMLNDVIESLYETKTNIDGRFCPGLFHCLYPYLKKRINNITFIDEEHSTIKISNKFRLGKFK